MTDLLDVMAARLGTLPPRLAPQREFLGTCRRTTAAVGDAVARGDFEDGPWVDAWGAVFADLYLRALDADTSGDGPVPLPWRRAFDAPAHLHPLAHVLLGMNAHINYDLPQALLAVIDDAAFADPAVLARRRRDHERIDEVLAARVAAEDAEMAARVHVRRRDHAMRPLNRWASRRFLREARRRVWHSTTELQRARLAGPDAYARRLAQLEVVSADRIADLLRPGPVLVRLAVVGFGVTLPAP